MLRKYIELREWVIAVANDEEGSEVAQATGVAIVAAGLIGILTPFAASLKGQVQLRFNELLTAISTAG